jgi:hypothetical protein
LGSTSSPTRVSGFFERLNSAKCRVEFPQHFGKWRGDRRPACDEHIVVAPLQDGASRRAGRQQSHHFPQSAPYPVALHGVAHLSRNGEPDPNRPVVGARSRLQREASSRGAQSARGGTKFAPALQPFHDNNGTGFPFTH